jgi:hypothetical protein
MFFADAMPCFPFLESRRLSTLILGEWVQHTQRGGVDVVLPAAGFVHQSIFLLLTFHIQQGRAAAAVLTKNICMMEYPFQVSVF